MHIYDMYKYSFKWLNHQPTTTPSIQNCLFDIKSTTISNKVAAERISLKSDTYYSSKTRIPSARIIKKSPADEIQVLPTGHKHCKRDLNGVLQMQSKMVYWQEEINKIFPRKIGVAIEMTQNRAKGRQLLRICLVIFTSIQMVRME